MICPVKVPEVGESISEGVLVAWFKKDGEFVSLDDPLFELETDKITMSIPAQQSGKLSVQIAEGETVNIGQTVATIDTDQKSGETAETKTDKPQAPTSSAATTEQRPSEPPPSATTKGSMDLAPAVRRLVEEHQIDPHQIKGSGKNGRITKGDVLDHLDQQKSVTVGTPVTTEKPPASTDTWPKTSSRTIQLTDFPSQEDATKQPASRQTPMLK